MAKKDKVVPQEVETPAEFLLKKEDSAVAVEDQESTAEVNPAELFVDKKEEYIDGAIDTLAAASEGVQDEFLPVPISRIWLKSPGGVEYLIQAEDIGLLVIGNGKATVLCGPDNEIPPIQEELVAEPEPAPHPNRQYTYKPRG